MNGLKRMQLDIVFRQENKFPTKWEELSPVQFIQIVYLLDQFKQKQMSLKELQLRAYLELTGTNDRRLMKASYEFLEKNIFKNLGKMSFIYKILYKDDRYELLSPEMKKKLEKIIPEEVDAAEATLARKFPRSIDIDLCFAKQLIPCIYLGMRRKEGYTFSLTDGVLNTSITAGQYIDAVNALQQFAETKKEEYLNLLIAILYTTPYIPEAALSNMQKLKAVPQLVKIAVMLNWQAILTWLTTKTKYKVLFAPAEERKDEKRNILGMSSILYSLVEQGYGDLKSIVDIELLQLFDLMLKNLVQTAREMRDSKMKLPEIAEKLNLKIETLNELL